MVLQLRGTRRRTTLIAAGRRGLGWLEATPLARLTTLGPVQRLRDGVKPAVRSDEVLDLLAALTAAGVRCWLAGGWGIDALVGRQTRAHRDLDLVVDGADTATALAVLHDRGFAHVRPAATGADHFVPGGLLPHRHLLQRADLLTVDFHRLDADGRAALTAVGDAFSVGALDGVPVGCMSVAAQRALHEGFSLSAKHRTDLRLLDQLEC